jgi:DNA-binding response OmpR family regulator
LKSSQEQIAVVIADDHPLLRAALANVQESDVSRGFEAGADDYIKKPFGPEEVLARVQAILGRRVRSKA